MAIPNALAGRLSLPVIGSPMFIVSTPALVLAQCKAGIVGAFPALNARPESQLDEWLDQITRELADHARSHPGARIAPFAVNQIVHASNTRLEHDVRMCVKYKVPIVITSLRPPAEVVAAVHGYGGLVFHDVINQRHARKAAEQGVDGLIAVCTGAGGHAGLLSPFALLKEIRSFFDGTLILSGAMSSGADVLAAQAMGADLAYLGTRLIASPEAMASDAYKTMLVNSGLKDLIYTPNLNGVAANWLRPSMVAVGLDPDHLPPRPEGRRGYDHLPDGVVPWGNLWSAGQGVEAIDDVPSVAELVERLEREYHAACAVPAFAGRR